MIYPVYYNTEASEKLIQHLFKFLQRHQQQMRGQQPTQQRQPLQQPTHELMP